MKEIDDELERAKLEHAEKKRILEAAYFQIESVLYEKTIVVKDYLKALQIVNDVKAAVKDANPFKFFSKWTPGAKNDIFALFQDPDKTKRLVLESTDSVYEL